MQSYILYYSEGVDYFKGSSLRAMNVFIVLINIMPVYFMWKHFFTFWIQYLAVGMEMLMGNGSCMPLQQMMSYTAVNLRALVHSALQCTGPQCITMHCLSAGLIY